MKSAFSRIRLFNIIQPHCPPIALFCVSGKEKQVISKGKILIVQDDRDIAERPFGLDVSDRSRFEYREMEIKETSFIWGNRAEAAGSEKI